MAAMEQWLKRKGLCKGEILCILVGKKREKNDGISL
jgi:hypothetical protein